MGSDGLIHYADVVPYEQRLDQDWVRALSEGSRYFEEKSAVQDTLRRLVRRLDALNVAYAVVGGLALYRHGYRRFTDDVDLLVTADSLKLIHDRLEGLGYVSPFTGSKQLRDTENGVRIEFLVTGGFPGDGKPKPVAFPDPAAVGVESEGITYINLPTLIDLKLASGMTGGIHRGKDLIDVVELIKATKLPATLADQLNPFVRARYLEMWSELQTPDWHDEDWSGPAR